MFVLKWKYKVVYGFVFFIFVGGVLILLWGIIGVVLKFLNGVLNVFLGVNCCGFGVFDVLKLGFGGVVNSFLDGCIVGVFGWRRVGLFGWGYWNFVVCLGNLFFLWYFILINWFFMVMWIS